MQNAKHALLTLEGSTVMVIIRLPLYYRRWIHSAMNWLNVSLSKKGLKVETIWKLSIGLLHFCTFERYAECQTRPVNTWGEYCNGDHTVAFLYYRRWIHSAMNWLNVSLSKKGLKVETIWKLSIGLLHFCTFERYAECQTRPVNTWGEYCNGDYTVASVLLSLDSLCHELIERFSLKKKI